MKSSQVSEHRTLDVVTKDLAVALGTSLSQALSSLAASRHDCRWLLRT